MRNLLTNDVNSRLPLIITSIYWLMGSCFVLFSDELFPFLVNYAESEHIFRLVKDSLFVLITGFLLFILLSQMGKLKESEERYKKIVDTSPDAIFVECEEKIIYANSASLQMLGAKNKQQILGKAASELTTDERPVQPRRNGPLEEKILGFDGTVIDVESTYIPITFEGKSATLVHRNDITERNKERAELWETNHTLHTLIHSCPLAIIVLDLDFKVKVWNPAAEEIFGWTEKEVVGTVYPVVPKEELDSFYKTDQSVFEGNVATGLEVKRKRKDGTEIIASLSTAPIQDINGKTAGLIGVMDNITEHKKTEELLRKSEKLSAAGQLAAGVAHEIRNPLTSIKGFLQLMSKKEGGEDNQYVQIILPEITRIEEIITEILVLARPQSQKYEECNLIQLIDQVIALLNSHAILKNIEIDKEILHDPHKIYCDENQLKQVLINLLKNSIESMDNEGKVVIQIDKENDDKVIIRVIDEGCGISQERIGKLGEPFFTTKERGTGLGLMCSYKIIENHHGNITFNSEVGKGTVVDVELPISRQA